MRLAAAALLACAACRSDGPTAAGTVEVTTYAGDRPAPGTRVIASRPTGDVVDDTETDAVGVVTLRVDPDSLVSIVADGRALTTTVPAAGGLALHLPVTMTPPILVVGTIDIAAPALAEATTYEVDLGCVTLTVTQLPDTFDVTACSTGSDRNLDVLVRALAGTTVAGISSGRVPLVEGKAVFDVPAWEAPPAAPITLDGIAGTASATYLVDGNEYAAPLAEGVTETLLVVDTGTQRVERHVPGIAAPWTVNASDLLAAEMGDAVSFRAEGGGVIWEAALPLGAGLPVLPVDLGVGLGIGTGTPVARFVDSSVLDGFDALQAAGIFADSIAAIPTDGTLRMTYE